MKVLKGILKYIVLPVVLFFVGFFYHKNAKKTAEILLPFSEVNKRYKEEKEGITREIERLKKNEVIDKFNKKFKL